jgi:hypothetical protein
VQALAGSNPASSAAPETSSDDRGADLLLSGAEAVATPGLAGKARGFVPYGERQQAYSVLSDLGDPILSSTPPPVVGLFGGPHVASLCWARR